MRRRRRIGGARTNQPRQAGDIAALAADPCPRHPISRWAGHRRSRSGLGRPGRRQRRVRYPDRPAFPDLPRHQFVRGAARTVLTVLGVGDRAGTASGRRDHRRKAAARRFDPTRDRNPDHRCLRAPPVRGHHHRAFHGRNRAVRQTCHGDSPEPVLRPECGQHADLRGSTSAARIRPGHAAAAHHPQPRGVHRQPGGSDHRRRSRHP